MNTITLNPQQQAMLDGRQGRARQMAMRLLLDMAAAAGADELVPIHSAHLSGVSPLTGGLGLRRFLARLAEDPEARVAVPTTLNAAGCDEKQFDAMRIVVPNFLEHHQEIVALYTQLGVQPIQSCVPYEWEDVVTTGVAAWAESNAICYGNSYTGLLTNRESGLSALACALTGYTPLYSLLQAEARHPNLEVIVSTPLDDPTDFSILGDWIGRQKQPGWRFPFGPIPLIYGLDAANLSHEQRKALAAAAANYGSPLLYIEGLGEAPPATAVQGTLHFNAETLQQRYDELQPRSRPSLIVLGCPQASLDEMRAVARLVKGKQFIAAPATGDGRVPLWLFTSAQSLAIAERAGLAAIIRDSGVLLLENTCPEVVPYDTGWVKDILTNSMKAEHYLKSGLNSIPTAVMRLADCIKVASGEWQVAEEQGSGGAGEQRVRGAATPKKQSLPIDNSQFTIHNFSGRGLPSQGDFTIRGEAFVTDTPITFLGFVNRESGVIEEEGHPANGESLAGKIAIFPKGSGSTVAPYVLLELFYRGLAPLAIINRDIDQQSAPACSLEGIPYAYGFDGDVIHGINHGATVELSRRGDVVTLRALVET